MPRLAVVSDTHGNMGLLSDALTAARTHGRLDAVIHLGDDHTDIAGMVARDEELLTVPGLCHPDYGSRAVPIARTWRFGGLRVLMAHQPADMPRVTGGDRPTLWLHGHTHSLSLSAEPWGLRFNPGHLAGPVDRGRPPTFGVVEIDEERLRIRALSPEGITVLESCWPLALVRRNGGRG